MNFYEIVEVLGDHYDPKTNEMLENYRRVRGGIEKFGDWVQLWFVFICGVTESNGVWVERQTHSTSTFGKKIGDLATAYEVAEKGK